MSPSHLQQMRKINQGPSQDFLISSSEGLWWLMAPRRHCRPQRASHPARQGHLLPNKGKINWSLLSLYVWAVGKAAPRATSRREATWQTGGG